jgi:bifunctional non-homologous end joining protein LigD
VLVLAGRDLTGEPLVVRRKWLQREVLPRLADPIRYAAPLEGSLQALLAAVRAHGFEGLVAKRLDSHYERGQRSGAWRKMRVPQGQEFVIGGYTPGGRSFDALVLGVYEGKRLLYVARTRNGFTPRLRLDLFPRLRALAPRGEGRPLEPGPDRREDGRVPVAAAAVGGTGRVRGMDTRRPPPAFALRGPAGRQGSAVGDAGALGWVAESS